MASVSDLRGCIGRLDAALAGIRIAELRDDTMEALRDCREAMYEEDGSRLMRAALNRARFVLAYVEHGTIH